MNAPAWMPSDCRWDKILGDGDDEFQTGFHIEQYNPDTRKVDGRAQLEPEDTASLLRQIARTPAGPAPRQPRGPLLQQRMATARRNVQRRYGNVA